MRASTLTTRAALAAAAFLSAASPAWARPQDGTGEETGEWAPEEPVDDGTGAGNDGSEQVSPSASGSSVSPSSTASASSPSSSSSSSSPSGDPCNNSPDLCGRSYNNITHMGAHNAPFLRDESTDNSVAGNHYYNATKALDAGFRLLQGQVHEKDGALHLCHSSCSLLDAGTLEDWLSAINYWMGENTNDVVTIILVNAAEDDVDAYGKVFEDSGIDQYGYSPSNSSSSGESSSTSWPTLQEMIDDDTRLVTFVTNIDASSDHSYLLPEFEYVFETPFEVTSASGFNCTLDRPSGKGSAETAIAAGLLPLMNHFLYNSIAGDIMVPDEEAIEDTNSPKTGSDAPDGALGVHAAECSSEWSQAPVFILVDFWDQGPAIDTADSLNSVEDPEGRDENAASADSAAAGRLGGTPGAGAGALVAFVAAAVVFF